VRAPSHTYTCTQTHTNTRTHTHITIASDARGAPAHPCSPTSPKLGAGCRRRAGILAGVHSHSFICVCVLILFWPCALQRPVQEIGGDLNGMLQSCALTDFDLCAFACIRVWDINPFQSLGWRYCRVDMRGCEPAVVCTRNASPLICGCACVCVCVPSQPEAKGNMWQGSWLFGSACLGWTI